MFVDSDMYNFEQIQIKGLVRLTYGLRLKLINKMSKLLTYFIYILLGIDIEKQLKTLPIKYGSMVLFNNVIPHRR
jgi:hypothetical protein